jgi:hypothetical protein
MKKVSTVAARQGRNISQQKLTIGLDLAPPLQAGSTGEMSILTDGAAAESGLTSTSKRFPYSFGQSMTACIAPLAEHRNRTFRSCLFLLVQMARCHEWHLSDDTCKARKVAFPLATCCLIQRG